MHLPHSIHRLSRNPSRLVPTVVMLFTPLLAIGQVKTSPDPAVRQSALYDRLAEPAAASSLKLSDEQRAQIAELLKQRDAALANAAEEQKAGLISQTDEQLRSVLTDEQREMFSALFLKRLEFNFQYQKWADVLEWIAEESGLSLVMDAPPAGTFNYSDSKEYSPTEAIDLLNGWLQTKNYSLVRRDRLLMLLDLTDGVPVGVIPRVAVDELPSRGRFELVSVLVPLGERPPEGAVAEIKPLLGRHGTTEPLPQTKQLLITDTAGNLLAIRALVESLPVPSPPPAPPKPPDPVLAVYPLQHANPAKVGDVLREILSGKIVVDEAASQVSVNAVPADQDRAKAIIAQLEANQGPEKQPRLETYPAPRNSAAEVIATLQLVAPGSQLRINAASQQLQVWAAPQDQQKIRETLAQLGTSSRDGGQSQLEVYPVSGVAPQAAMTALTTVMPGIRVTVDAAGHKLIVVGSLAEHQAVARLIEQLQSPGDPRLATTVKTYPLTRIDSSVTSLLSTLVPNAQVSVDNKGTKLVVVASGADHERIAGILEQVGDEDTALKRSMVSYPLDRQLDLATVTSLLSTIVPRVQVTSDAANHRLLIVATVDDHQTVASTIEQVAKDAGVELPQLEFYTLEKVDGARAVPILQPLVPAAQITFDAPLKRLSVIARPADHQSIKQTLSKLEEVSQEPEDRALKVYDVSPTQKSRFSSLAAGLASELTHMQVLNDAEPGELAIWATPSEHAVVENVLRQLERDLPDELTPKLVSYPLLKTDAATLSTVLTPLFPNVRINVDPKANRLLIWARPAEHETLRQALQELDTDAPVESEFKLMAYPVDGVTPEIAAQMIQSELPGLTVITDPTAKALIIRARGREHERIAAMLDAVKGSRLGTRERSVVVYPSIPGDPNEIYNFFARSIPSASVLVDRATGRMSVWASAAEHAQISHAVADMIGTGEGGLKAVLKTYLVHNAPPGTVSTLVSQVVPTAKLAVSVDGRHLSVWARETDHDVIQGVINGLAVGPDGGEQRSVAVFNVKPIGTGAARSLLAPIVPQVTFADVPDGSALLAWVNETDRQRIEAALAQVLGDKTLSGVRELKIYDLNSVGGAKAQQVLTSTMPTVSFTSTDGGKTVVVWARHSEHEQIQATISELAETQPFRDDRAMELYSLRDLGPNVTGMLSTLVPGAQISPGPQPDQIAVTARAEDQQKVAEIIGRLKDSSRPRYRTIAAYDIGRADPEAVRQIMQPLVDADVQITVDAKTRRVFVRTYTDRLEGIEAVVKRITEQQGSADSLTTRTYQLNQGEADEAQEVLQALMPAATLVTDNDKKVLAATATAEQHELIESVVEDMRGAFGADGTSQPMTYALQTADPDSTLLTLRNLFVRSPEVSLSVDRPTRTLIAIARPDQQETIRTLIEQLDRGDDAGRQRTVEVYPMRGTDSGTAIAIVRTLLESIDPDAKVAYNPQTRQVVVTTRAEGHARVREMTAALGTPETRDVEVFQLERMEPFTARLAVDGLFSDGRT
ncbi:MAG: secretin N-terminal domain-containing protein, partial [Planctomycetaceae bacterium]